MRYLILLMAFALPADAQEWSVEVIAADGGRGMGTLIKVGDHAAPGYRYGWVITANHVCPTDKHNRMVWHNGQSVSNCTVLHRDAPNDICVVWSVVPETYQPLELGILIKACDEVDFVGRYRRKFSGKASILTSENLLFADSVLIPGDSGGAVLHNGYLVGVISGGWMWAPTEIKQTWPARAANRGPIAKLLEQIK